jgi:non-specific serine/threonine protein kinase/serine/threonine-protein kinase
MVRPPDARAAFLDEACEADAELRREVESLLASHQDAGPFLSEPAALGLGPAARARVGPYRLLDVIAHGGMGTVYRAVRDDDAFQKTVALKLVRGGAASEYTDRRFRQERRILARLQHPNIATILDGGATEEGQPYLVMEHVDGRAITAYCEEQDLGTRDRLALFSKVCAAVQYAHQNLIVHRDLKPDNVLVTTDGTPKLLDFGIAKLLAAGVDPETAPTATLLPMMTPQYASPEQVRGEPVTTASDVYSLGVLLYELLTSSRPYSVKADSMQEIVRAVCETEPSPPSSAVKIASAGAASSTGPTASELRGDLDTIVLRALQKDPARRYGSAQELVEDIRRHLEGRPVLARPDTLGYRAGKFLGRHRVVVTAAVLVAVSVVAGFVATVRQRRIAEAERARAERRFADVRRLANSVLFDLEEAIRDLPGSTPARQLVVNKALEYLDSLAREADEDSVLQAELAVAYQKVGDVQGNPFGANLGDTAGAVESYRKEVAIRKNLAARDSRSAGDLAAAYRRLGLLEDEAGEMEAGVAHLNQALRLAERLVAEDSSDQKGRRLLARAHDGAGLLALKAGDHARAEEHQRRALAIWDAEVLERPDDQEALRGLHLIHGDLARTLRVTGRLPEATEHYRLALDAAQSRLELAPDDPVARRDESNGYTNLAVALYAAREYDEAARHIATSLAFDEAMLRADPNNSQVQRDVSWDLGFLAELASAQGKLDEALAHQRRSLALDQARATASPDSFQARKDLAENWSSLSALLGRLQRLETAIEASSESLALFDALRRGNPEQTRVQQLMAVQYGRHAALLEAASSRADVVDRAQRREACLAYGSSLDLWNQLSSRGAAIDDEYRQTRIEMEAAVARCDRMLGGEFPGDRTRRPIRFDRDRERRRRQRPSPKRGRRTSTTGRPPREGSPREGSRPRGRNRRGRERLS